MRSQSRQIRFIIVAMLIADPILFVLFWQAKDKRAAHKYKQQLLAAGEKLDTDQLIARPADPESNSASRTLAIFRLPGRRSSNSVLTTNEPHAMHIVAPGKAAVAWAQPAIIDKGVTNLWNEELEALSREAPPPEWIEQIITHPVLDFHLDYHMGFGMLLPHLAPLKYASTLLCIGVVCDLHRHDPAAAVAQARAILAEAHAMRDERLIISQLVRIAITHIGIAAIWELLQSPDVTDGQLAALQQDLARLEFIQPYEQALEMERAMQQRLLDRMRNSSAEFRRLTTGMTPATPSSSNLLEQAGNFALFKSRETAWNYAWGYPDELRSLKGFQVLIEGLRSAQAGRPYFEITNHTEQQLANLGIRKIAHDDTSGLFGSGEIDVRTFLSHSVLSLGIGNGINRLEATEIARNLAVTAIALQRYRLRHGQFPPDLAALAPEILPAPPRDPVDGKPLRYRRNPDGAFLLYSIGPDGVDDGGDPRAPVSTGTYGWQRGRDWVWPQPATQEEIADFNKKNAKK
jgi:hypothetical protein